MIMRYAALVFALGIAITAEAADWVTLAPIVAKHVPRVEIQKAGQAGVCSAVVFDVDTDGFAYALTAGHCVSKASESERIDLTVSGRNAAVLHSNAILDLAILKYRAKDDKPISLAPDTPAMGTEIAIVGFAFGVEELVMQFGRIAQSYNRESKSTWLNADLIFGDSGGAAVDSEGRLVGINSRIYTQGPAHIGAVVTVDQIRDYIDNFKATKKQGEKK